MSLAAATSDEDRRLMRAALVFGGRHNGLTWPNPSVGAILTQQQDGRTVIVGQGVTARDGRPHAEPEAVRSAGDAARGATLYVSLEPCSHHGRTPPCVEAIVEAGIRRVVTALEDPDPRVAGCGHRRLREAGLDVASGVCTAEADRAHRGHLTRMRLGRPAITLKLARTRDGYAAGAPGEPRLMITGANAASRTHLLRAHADAILVGISTVVADDPRLDVRLPGLEDRRPVRVVLDGSLRLPVEAWLVRTACNPATWVVCGPYAELAAEGRLRDVGVDVIRLPETGSGHLDLRAAMSILAERGLTRILCEGGPTLADALAEADLLDDVVLLTSSRDLGRVGIPALGPSLSRHLSRRMRLITTEPVGADTMNIHERAPCSPDS